MTDVPSLADFQALQRTVDSLAAAQCVRQLMARYMQLCDVPRALTRAEDLTQLFTRDAIWEGVGKRYQSKFGRLEGVSAIVEMLLGYLPPNPHFAFNAHFLSSERIEASASAAQGEWLMQQLSTYDTEATELIAARLRIDFFCEDGEWRIRHFRTERLGAFPLSAAQAEASHDE